MGKAAYGNVFGMCSALLILASLCLLWSGQTALTLDASGVGTFLAGRERLADADAERQLLELASLTGALEGQLIEAHASILAVMRSYSFCVMALAVLQIVTVLRARGFRHDRVGQYSAKAVTATRAARP